MSRILLASSLFFVFVVGCDKKETATQRMEKPAVAVDEPKQEQPKSLRTLRAKESVVLGSLNASVRGRQQFQFVFFNQTGDSRVYFDAKNKVLLFFNGGSDDLQSVTISMSTEDLLDEENAVGNIKTYLNAANRMVSGVFPSITEESDGWLDHNLVSMFLAKESRNISIAGYKLVLFNIANQKTVMYSILAAD